ncbi:MAG: hypothetical protein ACAF41_27965 [Leptolyngbya sp. BL-A-14]
MLVAIANMDSVDRFHSSTANQMAIAALESTPQGDRSPTPQSENHRQHRGDRTPVNPVN